MQGSAILDEIHDPSSSEIIVTYNSVIIDCFPILSVSHLQSPWLCERAIPVSLTILWQGSD